MPLPISCGRARAPFAVSLAAVLLALAAPAAADDRGATQPRAASRVPMPADTASDRIIVRYRDGVSASQRAAARATAGARPVRAMRQRGTELVRAGGDPQRALAALRRDPRVASAELDVRRHLVSHRTPNDPQLGDLWALHNSGQTVGGAPGVPDADIDAPEAWHHTIGSAGVVVAVIDTGVDRFHPDLAPNIWANPGESGFAADGSDRRSNGVDDDANGYVDDVRGWDWVGGDNDPRDLDGHGTHVAGTIAARGNDGVGVSGVTWSSRIMALRVLDADGNGSVSDILDAYHYAAAMGAQVANGSFSGGGPLSLEASVLRASSDTLFVFAAGNEEADLDSDPAYPCAYGREQGLANVLCVAATSNDDTLASYSNHGDETVDLAAPGSNILSTVPGWEVVAAEGFEGALGWTAAGTNASWATTDLAASGGTRSLTDSPGGPYLPETASTITRDAPVSLVGHQGCLVGYDFRLETESGADLVTLDASTDGVEWTTLAAWWGSTSEQWAHDEVDVAFADGGPLHLRFAFSSDEDVQFDGVYIDDVEVRCVGGSTATLAFASGTSMAAPHVAGVAALVQAQWRSATAAQVRASILASVDPLPGLATATVTGGRVNAYAALDTTPPVAALAALAMFTTSLDVPLVRSTRDSRSGVDQTYFRAQVFTRAHNGTAWRAPVERSVTSLRTVAAGVHSAKVRTAAGQMACYRAIARDNAWNRSATSTSRAGTRCTALPVNDRSLSASTGWSNRTSSLYYAGTARLSRTRGATLSASVRSARRISLVATVCPGCGSVEVWIGGARIRTVSLHRDDPRRMVLIPVYSSSTARSGTLRLKTTSSRTVIVEGLGVSQL